MKQLLIKFINQNLTTYEIAEKVGLTRHTVMNKLKKYGLKTNFIRGQVKNNIGNTGQISHLRKSCWELTRPLRIDRLLLEYPERNVCEKCKGKQNIQIHHKDENRKNNKKENIQVLCRRCHSLKHQDWRNK